MHDCESLCELFDGPSGTASIGRLLTGAETGRVVFLRRISGCSAEDLADEVAGSGLIAHPSLVKVLGLARVNRVLCIASEYIAGASLLQIANAARENKTPIEAKVCLKIVHDALIAAAAAKRRLHETCGWSVPRAIFSDTIWIAEYGETMLTEVGVSYRLHGPQRRSGPPAPSSPFKDGDVAAAGAELRRLLTDQRGRISVPTPFQEIVRSIVLRAEAPSTPKRFRDSEEMAAALAALPPGCMATEGEVGYTMRSLLGSTLERQHAKLGMLELAESQRVSDDATRVFNPQELANQSEKVTARPPAMSSPRDEEEPTRLWKVAGTDSTYDSTRMMFVEADANEQRAKRTTPEPALDGLSEQDLAASLQPPPIPRVDIGDGDELTQMFIPIFAGDGPAGPGQGRQPGRARADTAPIASMPLIPERRSAPSLAETAPARSAKKTRVKGEIWMGLAILVALLLVIAALVVGVI